MGRSWDLAGPLFHSELPFDCVEMDQTCFYKTFSTSILLGSDPFRGDDLFVQPAMHMHMAVFCTFAICTDGVSFQWW